MISINHPALGVAPISTADYRIMQSNPIRTFPVTTPTPGRTTAQPPAPVPPNRISPPIEVGVAESSGAAASSGSLPIHVSNIVDPVTGVNYAGYLTQDAQTLYQSGSLLTGGNKLTPQGSALAAQGDLIQGTPAPSPAQFTHAQPAAAGTAGTSWLDWFTEETLFPGYPNGLVAAGGVIAAAWLFGGKKGRR